jgi:agmatinase
MKTFAGIPEGYSTYQTASIVLIPVPYDGTSTWVKGADLGPAALLDAAENMELYDIECDAEVYREGIFLADPILENSSPEAMCAAVQEAVKIELEEKKFVTLIGGEHSISIGSIKAFADHFPNLTVLQIDAHADLRPQYQGSACNHACAVHWASKNCNLVQVGIRSMATSEKEHMNEAKTFFAHHIDRNNDAWMDEVIGHCTSDVFITIDLDAFDPSIMPSTGTPEPGGLYWEQVLKLCRKVIEQRTVQGFDIVELAPNPNNKGSDFLAAKLYYKLLTYRFCL